MFCTKSNNQEDDCLANDPVKNDIEDFCSQFGLMKTKTSLRVRNSNNAPSCYIIIRSSKTQQGEIFNFMQRMNWRAIVSYKTTHAVRTPRHNN